ncbi:LysR family transcriptional regulator [Paraburkholderia caribensis]|uniref:LysR family transcriptional regulator n=1 Tax=Paraburkholderia caribensis TaxID=75105 RepID=UPI0034D253BE
MDRLQAMQVFTKVVELNGFSKAAEALNLPRASATTIVKNLEAHLRVRLLQRTTRRLNLTPEGATYYERCVRILAEIDETEDILGIARKNPRGRLRIDMPGSVGRLIVMPQIENFRAAYPEIELVLGVGDKAVDLIQEGVDCAIRVGTLEDSSLIPRQLGELKTITAASPSYLDRFGKAESLEQLAKHTAVQYISNRTGRTLPFTFVIDGKVSEAKIPGKLSVNDADTYITCGVNGAGIIQAPRFMLVHHLHRGDLVEILPGCRPRPMPVAVVYPNNRHLAPKVSVFIDWIAELFEQCPLLSDDDPNGSVCELGSERLVYQTPRHSAWAAGIERV